MRSVRFALVAAVLTAGLALQLHFLKAYPQPALFGDPAEYYTLGHRLHRAVARALVGHGGLGALAPLRGMLYMVGVASVFGGLDALRPNDLNFLRVVMSVFNTVAMLGSFFLARGMSRSFAGGLLGLSLAAVYPSFALQTPRLYPDPLTGCFFVWAAYLALEGVRGGSARTLAASALVLSAGLVVRSQIIDFMFLFLGAASLATAVVWLRSPGARRLALVFLLSLLPLGLFWGVTRSLVGRSVDPLVQLGNETFKPYYPYGFWQYLDTDGWIGPYRLKTEPYARALQAQTLSDPRLLRSFPRQILFTLVYVAGRWRESVLLVLDNAYRLFDRPANDYKWDYPFSYPLQVALQRAVVVLALAEASILLGENVGFAIVFLMPVAVTVLHALVFPWPRYNLPVMPILLAAAGAFLSRLRFPPRAVLGATGLGGLAYLLGRAIADPGPQGGRLLRAGGVLVVLAVPFLWAGLRSPEQRRPFLWPGLIWSLLACLTVAHDLRDRLWHQFETRLDAVHRGVEQEIRIPEDGAERLREAGEVFLALDLLAPDGDVTDLRVSLNGAELPTLSPTMPRLPESTTLGGRDWHGYPQWWAVRVPPALLLPPGQPLRVRVWNSGSRTLWLKGDRFSDQARAYEGPSFGDWPKVVDLKLEYDGDYRLGVRLPLASSETRSFVLGQDGERGEIGGVHRIRLVTLANDEGHLEFETASAPSGAALGFFAFSGQGGEAQLKVEGGDAIHFPLGATQDFSIAEGDLRLCYRGQSASKGPARGAYVLEGLPSGLGSRHVAVRFQTGMSLEPRYFIIDPAGRVDDAGPSCAPGRRVVSGVGRMLDGSRSAYPDSMYSWLKGALGDLVDAQGIRPPDEAVFRWSVAEVF